MKRQIKRYRTLFISFLIIIFILVITHGINRYEKKVFAQSEVTPVITLISNPLPTPISTEKSNIQVAVLEAQLDEIKSFDEKLINTVYWALGTVVTLALLLVAYNWYTNNSLYQKDVKNISNSLSFESKQMFSDYKQSIDQELNTTKQIIDQEILKMKQSIDLQVSESHDKYRGEIDLLEAAVAKTRDEMKKDLYIVEARLWQIKGVSLNVITCCISSLKVGKIEKNYHIDTALDLILDSLVNINTNGTSFIAHRLTELQEVIAKIPPKHYVMIQKINAEMEKVKT